MLLPIGEPSLNTVEVDAYLIHNNDPGYTPSIWLNGASPSEQGDTPAHETGRVDNRLYDVSATTGLINQRYVGVFPESGTSTRAGTNAPNCMDISYDEATNLIYMLLTERGSSTTTINTSVRSYSYRSQRSVVTTTNLRTSYNPSTVPKAIGVHNRQGWRCAATGTGGIILQKFLGTQESDIRITAPSHYATDPVGYEFDGKYHYILVTPSYAILFNDTTRTIDHEWFDLDCKVQDKEFAFPLTDEDEIGPYHTPVCMFTGHQIDNSRFGPRIIYVNADNQFQFKYTYAITVPNSGELAGYEETGPQIPQRISVGENFKSVTAPTKIKLRLSRTDLNIQGPSYSYDDRGVLDSVTFGERFITFQLQQREIPDELHSHQGSVIILPPDAPYNDFYYVIDTISHEAEETPDIVCIYHELD